MNTFTFNWTNLIAYDLVGAGGEDLQVRGVTHQGNHAHVTSRLVMPVREGEKYDVRTIEGTPVRLCPTRAHRRQRWEDLQLEEETLQLIKRMPSNNQVEAAYQAAKIWVTTTLCSPNQLAQMGSWLGEMGRDATSSTVEAAWIEGASLR